MPLPGFASLAGLFGYGGDTPQAPFFAPTPDHYARDQIKTDLFNGPYRGPGELDQYGRETPEMRRKYLDIAKSEAVVRSALLIKVAGVAARPVSVIPDDKKDPRDKLIAEFVLWVLRNTPGGTAGIITRVYRPALQVGWSVSEARFGPVNDPGNHLRSTQWAGRWGIERFASKDTSHLRLQLDQYRNVTGIVNFVRGLEPYSRDRVVLYSHLDLYDNPFGESDIRAAYRTVGMIDDTYRLWYFALQMYGQPYMVGKTGAINKLGMERLLKDMRGGRFGVLTGEKDSIELLNLMAASGMDAFERKVRILREEAFLAINGTYMPFMQSNAGQGESRGDSETSKDSASDPLLELAQRAIEAVFDSDIIPKIVIPNFGRDVGYPKSKLSGHDWQETKVLMEVAKAKKDLGGSVGKRWLAETSQVPDAEDPTDELQPPQPAGPGGGPPALPGAAGATPPASAGQPGQPVPPALPPHEAAHAPQPKPATFADTPPALTPESVSRAVDRLLAELEADPDPFPRAPARPGRPLPTSR